MARFNGFGTIIHATLRSEDLLPAFLDEAERRFNPRKGIMMHSNEPGVVERFDKVNALRKVLDAIEEVNDDDVTTAFYNSEWASEVVNEDLPNMLDEDLPPYVYFGCTEGDGSDFGYWFNRESFESDVEDGEVVKVDSLDGITFPTDHMVAVISDHGNVTLYDTNGEEVYAIV